MSMPREYTNAGETGTPRRRLFRSILSAVALLGSPTWVRAIDNPDTPDRVAEFLARAKAFEKRINEESRTDKEILVERAKYEQFLDKELNEAYRLLTSRMDESSKKDLIDAQRRWLAFRDAEFRFIATHWTSARYGSSYALSKGGYRNSVIKDRVVSLLHYVKNTPNP
jgi:uncharacterized protein YecT (DUF1311 family)